MTPNKKKKEKARKYIKAGYLCDEKYNIIHRVISEKTDGKIPNRWHVHHCDFNKQNNDPGNLVQIPASLHSYIHSKDCPVNAPSKDYILEVLMPKFFCINTDKNNLEIEKAIELANNLSQQLKLINISTRKNTLNKVLKIIKEK